MAIDRHDDDDDGPATTVAVDEIEAAPDESFVPDGKCESPEAEDRSSDLGPGIPDDGDRAAYHAQYRETVDAEYRAAARERWHVAKPEFEAERREYARVHLTPLEASPELDQATITKVKDACDQIWETEDKIVTPAMLRIEAADPERQLVGLAHRRKGDDRIMDKVAAALEEQPDLTPKEALSSVKDAIRYTFQYTEEHYSEGVLADIDRLKAEGYEPVDIRNSWASDGYTGINSRWQVPENGQLFEVQFHTKISFEVKQLTHEAYERLRRPSTTKAEQDELVDFQQRVNAFILQPRRAFDIPDYP
jgi:hypothetical protein